MPPRLLRRDLRLHRPLATAHGVLDRRTVWVLDLGDGLGEAAPLPGFGGEAPMECARALTAILPLLPADPGAPLPAAAAALLVGTPCARHAVEGALADRAARHAGLPLARWRDAGACTRIPVNALAADATDAARAAAAGHRTIKLKARPRAEDTLALIAGVRTAVGPGIALRVDANGAWDAATARRVADGAPDLAALEQPLPAEDLAGLARLQAAGPVPIALDESLRSIDDLRRAVELGAGRIAVLKPMFLGGWDGLQAATAFARRHGWTVVLSSALDGGIARAHALHAACALGLDGAAHGLATGAWLADETSTDPHPVQAGGMAIDAHPGLGAGAAC